MYVNVGRTLAASLVLTCLVAPTAWAYEPLQEKTVEEQLDEMRRAMKDMEERHKRELDEVRRELRDAKDAQTASEDELGTEIDLLIDRMDELQAGAGRFMPPGKQRAWLDISVGTLFAVGTSTEGDEIIQQLEGGGHDPKRRGFTVQQVELAFTGGVDPYFDAAVFITTQLDQDGETNVELEEAYAQTTSLPYGLQIKAGTYLTAFGRHNPTHAHSWEFVDAPVTNTRFLGPDGMRGPGAQLSWLAPTETPLEFTLGVQNADGETMTSFVGVDEEEEGEDGHGHGHGGENSVVGERREFEVHSLDDMVYTGRVQSGLDVDDENTTLFGLSAAFGPNASGRDTDTQIFGGDVAWQWRPLDAHKGFPFIKAQIEAIWRRFDFDTFEEEHEGETETVRGRTLDDWGFYAQVVYGFKEGWTAGVRWDRVDSDLDHEEPGLDDRDRVSGALTHYFSEFSKVRLQVNWDDADSLDDDVWSFWLQFEFDLGAHAGHKF